MSPDSDHVARAVVAACRATGENPLEISEPTWPLRARHYAHHALVHCFPGVKVSSIARMVGAPRPDIFHDCSLKNHVRRRASKWWDDAIYQRVIEAIGVEPSPRALPPPARAVMRSQISLKPSGNNRSEKAAMYEMLAAAVANTPGARKA